MWLFFALGSAFFAGLTAILAKTGIKNTDSNVATALRTGVVLVFAWLMVFIVGSENTLSAISDRTLLFLALSGLATGASWLCYFRALQLGDVNKVAPVDKSSTVLTVILAFIILGEQITLGKLIGIIAIGVGTFLMIEHKDVSSKGRRGWFLYAALSAVFAALTAILGKIGIANVESNLGTALRTCVVLVMAWVVVFVTGKQKTLKTLTARSLLFIVLSGIATGASWLCYYRALQTGDAGVVVPVDKLSIVVTVAFSYIFLKEKLSRRAIAGLLLIVAGTLVMIFVKI